MLRSRALAAMILVGGWWSMSVTTAHALPYHGYNAYHEPCAGDSTFPASCMGTTEFGWMSGKPVTYRFAVKQADWVQDGGAKYKRAIDRMRARGVAPFVILNRGSWGPPLDDAAKRNFYDWTRTVGRELASRGVQDYEIWNEPNAAQHWGAAPNAWQYATTYCWAVWGLKESGTTARVHLGGVARPASGVIAERDWLRGVKYYIDANCPKIAIDGVSYHPYTPEYPDTTVNAAAFENLISNFRLYMNENGLSGSMLMATEMGFPNGAGNPDLHKRQLMALLDRCWDLRHRYYIRACYWFPLIDVEGQSLGNAGLVDRWNNPRPAFWEFLSRLDWHRL